MSEAPKPIAIREAVDRRLAKRYRAERRFRMFGIAAIAVSISFLVILIASLARNAVPAFTAYEIDLPVTLSEQRLDRAGDRSEASLRRGSYNGVLQDALRAQFPEVRARGELRELFGLYASLNSATLLEQVVEDPELVGRTIDFRMPISDDADLFLKGVGVSTRSLAMERPPAMAFQDGRVEISADAEEFRGVLDDIRRELDRQAGRLEERAARQARRAASGDGAAAEAARADADRLSAEAGRLRARAAAEADFVELDATLPTLIVDIGGASVLVDRLDGDARTVGGRYVIPPPSTAPLAEWSVFIVDQPAAARRLSDLQVVWLRALVDRGLVQERFNTRLFTSADSSEPELAGVNAALIGSILTMMVTMLLAVPIGVCTAIYLEEFAPRNRITDLIEVNINNLAAVPSIVFGLLGLFVFLEVFNMTRSAPLVAGMVLALMTLPTVIISSRAALKSVPPSIRQAALGVGASRSQAVLHHVLPMAAPGMLTGCIIGLAQAMGETAPLLMIGMVAFIAEAPPLTFEGFLTPSTVMPVQIWLWSEASERAFQARAAAAALILLVMIIGFNGLAVYLRQRFERRG